jgi:hypothetical protein
MISPMKVIRLLVGILIYWNSSVAQFVRLENQQFKIGNDNFFPMCMNYTIEDVKNGNSFFPAPCHSYGNNNMNFPDILECDNLSDCKQQLQQHFNYIAGMGFNVIRLCELSPKFKSQILPINNLEAYSMSHEFVDITNSNDYTDIIQIPQISESEQGIQILLSELDVILECAANTVLPNTGVSHPMKIILLNEYTSLLTDNEVSFRAAYLKVLSKHIRNSPFRNAFFAHDLMNEPAPNLKPRKTKQKACEIIDSWYTAIKGEDPTQLVTLGTGIDDVFSFDPAIIHVDFLSLHVYPNWDRESDNHYDPAAQQRMRTRMLNDIYYFDKICPKPWIIGETGFKADDYSSFSSPPTPPPPGQVPTIPSPIPTTTSLTKMGYDGSLIDLGKFVNNSLYDACNCGAKGFSWWWFQETTFGDLANDAYGLLRLNWDPNSTNYGSNIEKQPAVNNFRNFTNSIQPNNNLPIYGGQCLTDYNPNYSINSMYYNPYLNPPNPTYTLQGNIYDNTMQPIDNALIFANSAFTIPNPQWTPINPTSSIPKFVLSTKYYFTHSDVMSHYKLTFNPPNNVVFFDPVSPSILFMNSIFDFQCSAPNASYYQNIYWSNSTLNIQNPSIINLENNSNNISVSNQVFHNSFIQSNLQQESITIDNCLFQASNEIEYKALKEILIKQETNANEGNELRFCIENYMFECPANPSFNRLNNSLNLAKKPEEASIEKPKNTKKIQLNFNCEENSVLKIFPIPAKDKLYFEFKDNGTYKIELQNNLGETVYRGLHNNNLNTLSLANLSRGQYIIRATCALNKISKKLIIE